MKTLITVIVLTVLMGCSAIQNNVRSWNKTDTAYQVTALAITAVDGLQTHWMAKNNWHWRDNDYSEICPLYFNSKPHQDAVDILIPVGMVVHTAIAFALPNQATVFGYKINPRRIWQVGFIFIESAAVGNNIINGARIEF